MIPILALFGFDLFSDAVDVPGWLYIVLIIANVIENALENRNN